LKITSGLPFERDALQARDRQYLASRRGQGYYEAKVDVLETAAANEHVDLTFTVNPAATSASSLRRFVSRREEGPRAGRA
jgi:outer membrane protein assembly factor BamA